MTIVNFMSKPHKINKYLTGCLFRYAFTNFFGLSEKAGLRKGMEGIYVTYRQFS